jgi:SAM-dependent methyltransferase
MFLIVGQRGSEARAVADVLDTLPDVEVAGTGELVVPLAFLLQRVAAPDDARRLAADLVTAHRGFADGIGRHLDPAAVHAALDGVRPRLGAVLAALYGAVADAAGVQVAGTLLPVMGNPVLNRTGLYDAGIQLVHVVRDVRQVVATADGHQTPTEIARQWDQANRLFRERRGGDPATYLMVRQEDLQHDPGRTMAELAFFLGVSPGTAPVPIAIDAATLTPEVEAEVKAVASEGLFEFGYDPPRGSSRWWARRTGRRARALVARAGRARRVAQDRAWALRAPPPWVPADEDEALAPAWCNVCRWRGQAFAGQQHAESADCPRCGTIARERFHLHGVVHDREGRRRVVEVDPRSGGSYARAMGRWFDYGAVALDELADRPDGSADDVVSAHDLQAVTDPDAVLAELARVLAPGGRLHVQVPLLAGTTTALAAPDNAAPGTARWAFGVDIADRVRAAGLDVDLLVTEELAELAAGDPAAWGDAATSGEVDLGGVLAALADAPLTPVADRPTARRCGWIPPVLFVTIRGVKAR